MNFDVIIVGGGLMGFSSALHLAMRGKSCVVLERDSAAKSMSVSATSRGNPRGAGAVGIGNL